MPRAVVRPLPTTTTVTAAPTNLTSSSSSVCPLSTSHRMSPTADGSQIHTYQHQRFLLLYNTPLASYCYNGDDDDYSRWLPRQAFFIAVNTPHFVQSRQPPHSHIVVAVRLKNMTSNAHCTRTKTERSWRSSTCVAAIRTSYCRKSANSSLPTQITANTCTTTIINIAVTKQNTPLSCRNCRYSQ